MLLLLQSFNPILLLVPEDKFDELRVDDAFPEMDDDKLSPLDNDDDE